MSDLFAPMPLPDRPVQRLADIAEREAANRQREIDTRLQESLETSRLQTMHEIGEAKEQYRTTLEELQQDYRRKALSQPTRTYSRGSSSRGRSYSQASSASNDRVAYNLENARLSGQFNKGKLQLRILADSFARTWQDEGWDDEKGWDNWQTAIEPVIDAMIYSQDERWSSVNTSYQIKMNDYLFKMEERIHKFREESKTSQKAHALQKQASETFLEVTNWYAMQSPPGDAMGLGMSYDKTPSWDIVEEVFTQESSLVGEGSLLKRNSEPWRMVRNSHIERLSRGAILETTASIEAAKFNQEMHGWSLDDHMQGGLAKAMSSPYYDSVDPWEIDEGDVEENFRSKMAKVVHDNEMENKAGIANFWGNDLEGNHRDMRPREFQQVLMSWGMPAERAWKMAQDHSKRQQDEYWQNFDAIKKEAEELKAEQVAQFSSNLGEALRTNPEWLDNIDDSRVELQRLEAVGFLEPGGSEYFERYLKPGNVAILNLHDPSRAVIKDFLKALAQDESTERRGGFLKMASETEAVTSVSSLGSSLYRELDRKILEGEDGDRLTPDAMVEQTKRTVRHLADRIDLKRNTREIITGISISPGGEAQPMTAYAIQPLPGAEAIFSRSVLDLAEVDEEGLAEYDAMDPERRSVWAINQIPLDSYKGTADDDAVHAQNEATLREYRLAGSIRGYVLDMEKGEVLIQLADNGEWHFRQLDSREAVEAQTDLSNALFKGVDVEEGLFEGLNSGSVGLTHEVPNALTGTVFEGPTVGAEVLERTVNTITRSVVNFANTVGLTNLNWEEMAAMFVKHDIEGSIFPYTGLRPWQME